MHETPRSSRELVHVLVHVHGNADGPGLVCEGAADRLPNPPGRISRKLIAAAIVELFNSLHEPDVAFLDEIEELKAAVRILLGDGDDETEVAGDELVARPFG